jgi:SRSO17 transposase
VAGITAAELAAVRGRLEAFAANVFESLPRRDQRARGGCYLRGLMLDGRRKSVEPMAERLGGEVQGYSRADQATPSAARTLANADPSA